MGVLCAVHVQVHGQYMCKYKGQYIWKYSVNALK